VQGKTRGLFKVPLQGGAATILANAPSPSSNPVWFPDNSLIVYSEAGLGRYNILGAVRPDGTPYKLPSLAAREENRVLVEFFPTIFSTPGVRVRSQGERYRVTPDSKSLILMFGTTKSQQFHLFNVATGEVRPLTNFRPGYAMRTFDISPDGKTILFDRRKDNSDIVLIELKQK
jgi:Tol biopolymer transport system component